MLVASRIASSSARQVLALGRTLFRVVHGTEGTGGDAGLELLQGGNVVQQELDADVCSGQGAWAGCRASHVILKKRESLLSISNSKLL